MGLTAYKKKRSFSNTPEPAGKSPASSKKKRNKLLFVVQKHHASRLHYDFRLEMKGVLKSWAVPKGPSMNPADKRLAMLVEDHPFDYKDFEGIIPKGNYGAGTVIIWDEGTYEPVLESEKSKVKTSKQKAVEKNKIETKNLSVAGQEKKLLKGFFGGSLRIRMHGKKLKGEFALVRSTGREENAWLLIKKTDGYSTDDDITKKDKSVISNKTIEQIAVNKKSKQWISNRSSNGKLKDENEITAEKSASTNGQKKNVIAEKNSSPPKKNFDAIVDTILSSLTKKKKTPMPQGLRPMLATLVDEPFDAEGWLYEIKWDGYRALAYLNKGKAELRSRKNNSFNEKFYPVTNALKNWPIKAIVDGEVVVINEKGLSDFNTLQNWTGDADGELMYYVFDILWLNGVDLMHLPLTERRDILQQLVPGEGIIKFSENFEASGTEFFAAADKLGLEGIIAKKADSTYTPDIRTKQWLKIKTEQRHEAIIAGYTRNEDSTKKFSALLLGVYKNNDLIFIGQVGTGFTDKVQTEVLKKLEPLKTKVCPFKETPAVNKPTQFRRNPPKAEVVWVKPKLVCEVSYQQLTQEGLMRHASFQGLREDKTVKEVASPQPSVRPDHPRLTDSVGQAGGPPVEGEQDVPSKANAGSKKVIKPEAASNRKKEKVFLNAKEETQTKTINGHDITFTNLSKVYWPKEKITKRDMLNYYYEVTPYMLPYMKDRPQSLNRHPNGINGESFYQKNVAGKVDDWLVKHNYQNTTHEGEKTFLVCTNEASLMYIAKLGCIEMNPWHSRISSPDNPDWCVIDLDPDDNPFEQVIEAANAVRKILDSIDVPSYPKTSGSTGIHIYIPLGAQYKYEQSKQLAELIVTLAHQEIADFTSLERSPAKRKKKIYLDYLQNRAIQTIAAPYSLRPKPGATVSMPLHWAEVKKGLSIQNFTIHNAIDRIKKEGDLFKGVLGKGINLEKVLNKINSVFG